MNMESSHVRVALCVIDDKFFNDEACYNHFKLFSEEGASIIPIITSSYSFPKDANGRVDFARLLKP